MDEMDHHTSGAITHIGMFSGREDETKQFAGNM